MSAFDDPSPTSRSSLQTCTLFSMGAITGSAPVGRVSVLERLVSAFRSLQNLCVRTLLPPKSRRLRVSETVALGDKRFVSIVQVDGVDYLIGGGTANVSLLTRLGPAANEPSFQETVIEAWGQTETA